MTPAVLRPLPDGEQIWLEDTPLTIGRDPSCGVHLDVASMSRIHAQIDRTPHGYVLADLGSRNGTFLNGTRIETTPQPLRDGDEIVFAGVASFRFIDPAATPAAPLIGRLTGVWIEPDSGTVWVDAQRVDPPLSQRQQALLELLDRHADTHVSRQTIIEHVWSDVAADGVTAQALDSLVKRLRSRLRPLQVNGELLDVTRDRGIRLRRL